MSPKDVEELLGREPFLPFRIFMADGNTLDVTRRLSAAVGRNGVFLVLPDDRWKWIPLRHVTSIETLQAA